MPKFTVKAKMTTYLTAEIEADHYEHAMNIAAGMDGGDFNLTDASDAGDWAIIDATLIEPKRGAHDFNGTHRVYMYDCGTYDSYEEALAVNAVYQTCSTIDDLTVESSGQSIGCDVVEVVACAAKCIGMGDLEVGIINKHDEFVKLPFVVE